MTDLDTLTQTIGDTNYQNGWHDRWFKTIHEGDPDGIRDHVVSKLALITTEVAEAIEVIRDGRKFADTWYDGDKPQGLTSELADIVIRTLDLANMLNLDITSMVREKTEFNATRGHKHGGKTL